MKIDMFENTFEVLKYIAAMLHIDPITIKDNTSKTIANIKANYPYQCN